MYFFINSILYRFIIQTVIVFFYLIAFDFGLFIVKKILSFILTSKL
jgi:hypothetical protein